MSQNTPPPIPNERYGHPHPKLLSEPRSCSTGFGVKWIIEAAKLFTNRWLLWVGIGLFYLVLAMIAQLSESISLIISFLSAFFIAGFVIGADTQATGGELRFGHLFIGFKTHFLPLMVLTLIYILALFIVIMITVLFVVGFSHLGLAFTDFGEYSVGEIFELIGVMLLMMIMVIPVLMSIFFAPALVVLHDIKPLKAMKMSFKGCLRNMLPLIVFLIVTTILFFTGIVITFGVGLLALLPILMITYYTSYRDVWTDQPISQS